MSGSVDSLACRGISGSHPSGATPAKTTVRSKNKKVRHCCEKVSVGNVQSIYKSSGTKTNSHVPRSSSRRATGGDSTMATVSFAAKSLLLETPKNLLNDNRWLCCPNGNANADAVATIPRRPIESDKAEMDRMVTTLISSRSKCLKDDDNLIVGE